MCRRVFSPGAAGTRPGLLKSSRAGRSELTAVFEPPLYQYSAMSASEFALCALGSTQPFERRQKRAALSRLSLFTTSAAGLPFQ